jgi:hypothetical protein
LDSKDSACVIAVKRITKLGFGAADILRQHFEQWGKVDNVLLSNVPLNGSGPLEHQPGMRRRPPGMGWVVMSNANDAVSALSKGEYHTVQTAHIRATPFLRRSSQEREVTIDEEGPEDQDGHPGAEDLLPFRGRWSDA